MKLSASASTDNGDVLIATYSNGTISFSRNDGTGSVVHVGSLNSCQDLEAICVASVALLVKLKQKGLALSEVSRIGELQQDLRKLTLRDITDDSEDRVVKDVDF